MADAVFVSTTIPYVNGQPHLGHAFEYVQADLYARHARGRGDEVFLASGTDENSLKNVRAARAAGVPVRDLVDRHAERFETLLATLQVRPDRFLRTGVDPCHRAGAMDLWRRMAEAGDIYERFYEGLYCVGCEQFVTPADLVAGCCPVHDEKPVQVEERNHFFRLSRYQEELVEALTDGRIRVVPEIRRNEVLAMASAGLNDISISRTAERAAGWGIPVPGDPDQVMYVWTDALTNYVNALGGPRSGERYDRFWEGARRRVHVLGKDVVRFHALYWPAMLLSAGLPLPTDLVVHGHITSSGRKLSKSSGDIVDPLDLAERYTPEALRYLLLAEFSPWSDTDFSEERLVARHNSDLADGLGNLVDRVISMLHRYRAGVVPAPAAEDPDEHALFAVAQAAVRGWDEALASFDHRTAVACVGQLVRRANAYLSAREPWHLAAASSGPGDAAGRELDTVLHQATAVLRLLAALVEPVLPSAAHSLLTALGAPAPRRPCDLLAQAGPGADLTGLRVGPPPRLFPRLEVTR